jgi:dihydropteroate synthase
MGIVNVTPDSFSDGGKYSRLDQALTHAEQLLAEGADILDIGGESTRPGATPVSVEDELQRVVPVVRELAKRSRIAISIDTMKAEVAQQCLDAGAVIINDVSGLLGDKQMSTIARQYHAGVVVMHMQGNPQTMQIDPQYKDVVNDIRDFFQQRFVELTEFGLDPNTICFDPGFGFGKTHEHNFTLFAEYHQFQALHRPVCLGISRKGFIGTVTGRQRHERLAGSLALACFGIESGSAQILRVHDVAPTRDAVLLYQEIRKYRRAQLEDFSNSRAQPAAPINPASEPN